MIEIFPDLWQTTLQNPFPGLNTHAYFIKRSEGNVLVYNTSNASDLRQIQALGGMATQFISHRHESGHSLGPIKAMFNSRLCASEIEAAYLEEIVEIAVKERFFYSADIELIPTPGHTDGGLSFLYKSTEAGNVLFTGDTLFLSNGEWSTLVFSADGGSRGDMLETLEIYRNLKPNVVISSGYSGDRCVVEIDPLEWDSTIDKIISNL